MGNPGTSAQANRNYFNSLADGALGGSILLMILLLLLSYGGLSALTILLPVLTARLAWKRWKGRGEKTAL